MGAMLALLAATRSDTAPLLGGVVAVSPLITSPLRQGRLSDLLERYRPGSFFRDVVPRFSFYGMGALDGMRSVFKRTRTTVRFRVGVDPLEQVRAFVQEIFEDRQVLREVRVPVLWLHGARDRVAPLERVSSLMKTIPSARFVHIDEKRGHRTMAMSSSMPEYIARFLEKCLDMDEESKAASS